MVLYQNIIVATFEISLVFWNKRVCLAIKTTLLCSFDITKGRGYQILVWITLGFHTPFNLTTLTLCTITLCNCRHTYFIDNVSKLPNMCTCTWLASSGVVLYVVQSSADFSSSQDDLHLVDMLEHKAAIWISGEVSFDFTWLIIPDYYAYLQHL